MFGLGVCLSYFGDNLFSNMFDNCGKKRKAYLCDVTTGLSF